jgi:hypothetical protein
MVASAEQKKLKRSKAVFLVEQLMEMKNCSRDEALEILLKTTAYEALMDSETELYLESREAIWDILKEELVGNPYRLLEL